jgi:hypothetical protein
MYTTDQHVTVIETRTIRMAETPCCVCGRPAYRLPSEPAPSIPLCAYCNPDEPDAR